MGANEKLFDKITLRRVQLIRIENAIVRRMTQILAQARQAALDYVAMADAARTRGQLDLLSAQFQARLTETMVALRNQLGKELEQLFSTEYTITANLLERVLPKSVRREFVRGTGPRVDIFSIPIKGVTFDQAIRNMMDRLGVRVDRQVYAAWGDAFSRAIEQGYSATEAQAVALQQVEALGLNTQEIRDLFAGRGMADLRMIVENHVSKALDLARGQVYWENRHLLRGVQWSATLDMKTCEECQKLDGQIWYYEGEPNIADMPSLPHHPHCRCCKIPVLREDIDPEPAPVKTYEEWLKSVRGGNK